MPDSEIMAYATVNNHVVLTHDLDFGACELLKQGVQFKSLTDAIDTGTASRCAIGNRAGPNPTKLPVLT